MEQLIGCDRSEIRCGYGSLVEKYRQYSGWDYSRDRTSAAADKLILIGDFASWGDCSGSAGLNAR